MSMKNKMTWEFVYEALLRELNDRKDNCDTDKYNLLYDYIYEIAHDQWVNPNRTPAYVIDNLIVNWDYAYEWDSRYDELLESWDYSYKWDWIIFIW